MAPAAPAIPGYRVLRTLGQGGMGAVYLVEPEEVPGARRALKLLPYQDEGRRARFQREAELLARVEGHPALARVHAAGEHRGQPWLVMEHIEGEDLDQLGRRGPTPWRVAAERVARVAEGLARVHALGVLHRDIKPANILVEGAGTPAERVVLIDFGVATAVDLERLTRTGEVLGTPHYMSPEAARGQPLDPRSDVYALGATLFELLTGRPLFDGETLGEVFQAVLTGAPRAPGAEVPGLPPALDALVLRAVAKDPARRPRDAGALAAELRELLAGRSAGRPSSRPLAAAALAAVAAVLGLALVGRWTAPPPPPIRPLPTASPAVPEPRPAPPPPNPLLDQVDVGSFAALRAVCLARDGRLKAKLPDDALDVRLRAAALAAAKVSPLDVRVLAEWLEAVGVVRAAYAKAGSAPPPDDGAVGDATLQAVEGLLLVDEASPGVTLQVADHAARLFDALAASRLRPGDRVAAELLVELVAARFLQSTFGGRSEEKDSLARDYDQVLRATVDLDIDVDAAQLSEASPDGPKNHQAAVLAARYALAMPSRHLDEQAPLARAAIDLERELADRLGPVVRARLLTAIPAREEAVVTLARLQRARDLDPDSASVRSLLAQVLNKLGRHQEAAAEVRVARARRALRRRPNDAVFRVSSAFDELCARILIDAEAYAEAQAVVDELPAGRGRVELEAELDRRERRGRR